MFFCQGFCIFCGCMRIVYFSSGGFSMASLAWSFSSGIFSGWFILFVLDGFYFHYILIIFCYFYLDIKLYLCYNIIKGKG